MSIKPKFKQILTLALLFILSFMASNLWAQEDLYKSDALLKTVKIGPHPIYTRILIDLTEPITYHVKANFAEKRIVLTLPETQRGPRVHSKAFNDKNLEQFTVSSREGKVKINFVLKRSNTRFFHSMNPEKPQIIIDLKGESRSILKAKIGGLSPPARGTKSRSKQSGKGDVKKDNSRSGGKVRLIGFAPEKVRNLISQDVQEKEKNGWEDYQKGLKEFQSQNYPNASKALKTFIENYPESKYLGQTL